MPPSPHPGMTDTYGCPIKNSAKPNTYVFPPSSIKNVQKPIKLMAIYAGLKIKKLINNEFYTEF